MDKEQWIKLLCLRLKAYNEIARQRLSESDMQVAEIDGVIYLSCRQFAVWKGITPENTNTQCRKGSIYAVKIFDSAKWFIDPTHPINAAYVPRPDKRMHRVAPPPPPKPTTFNKDGTPRKKSRPYKARAQRLAIA